MGGMREIVDLGVIGRLFAVLAIALPLVGLALGAGGGTRRGQARQGAVTGVMLGALGTLNWLLWLAYNAITSRLGLDTTRNVIVNLVFFVLVGLALGASVGFAQRCLQPVQTAQNEAEVLPEMADQESETSG